jgi:hypothetical protein
MNIYDLYKPFRNQLRKMILRPSLEHIWQYQQSAAVSGIITFRTKLGNANIEIYMWELHLLCREILLHADGDQDTISTPLGLMQMINHIRRINDGISERTVNSGDDAMRVIHTLIHQQARWQYSRDEARMFRAFKIYNDYELAPIFEQTTGLSVRTMFLLALAIGGAAKRRPDTNVFQDYSDFGVTHQARDRFFQLAGTTLPNIRRELERLQRDDEGWEFTWNPMEATPLINLDNHQTPLYLCPLPDLLLRRITEGLFYDLGKSKCQFGNEYGRAFERYVMRVLQECFDLNRFSISGEQPYEVGGQIKHGVDGIVSDATGHIFIECKTRRMKQGAKETAEGITLKKSLDELAEAVVQLYKNIDDATKGLSKWIPNRRPIYPFVITYEDWYLFTPQVFNQLIECVQRRLKAAELLETLTETMPFFVTSINEFEMAGQDIAHLGIERFCAAGVPSGYRHFQLSALAQTVFPNEAIVRRLLLVNSWNEIFPEMEDWAKMAG